jgi:hypothetical protein
VRAIRAEHETFVERADALKAKDIITWTDEKLPEGIDKRTADAVIASGQQVR